MLVLRAYAGAAANYLYGDDTMIMLINRKQLGSPPDVIVTVWAGSQKKTKSVL